MRRVIPTVGMTMALSLTGVLQKRVLDLSVSHPMNVCELTLPDRDIARSSLMLGSKDRMEWE